MMDFEEMYKIGCRNHFLGKITDDEWQTFCMVVLDILMEQNSDVLKRLKNCGEEDDTL